MTDNEPTASELTVIEDEWPVIRAELAVVAVECRLAASHDPLSIRAHRRAVSALAAAVRESTTHTARHVRPFTAA